MRISSQPRPLAFLRAKFWKTWPLSCRLGFTSASSHRQHRSFRAEQNWNRGALVRIGEDGNPSIKTASLPQHLTNCVVCSVSGISSIIAIPFSHVQVRGFAIFATEIIYLGSLESRVHGDRLYILQLRSVTQVSQLSGEQYFT